MAKESLESHIKESHTRDVVYQCEECPKSFHLKDSFNKHILYQHTPEKAYSCEECGKEFGVKGSLTEHVYRMHSKEKRHACGLCPSKFKSTVMINDGCQLIIITIHFIIYTCGAFTQLKLYAHRHTDGNCEIDIW